MAQAKVDLCCKTFIVIYLLQSCSSQNAKIQCDHHHYLITNFHFAPNWWNARWENNQLFLSFNTLPRVILYYIFCYMDWILYVFVCLSLPSLKYKKVPFITVWESLKKGKSLNIVWHPPPTKLWMISQLLVIRLNWFFFIEACILMHKTIHIK